MLVSKVLTYSDVSTEVARTGRIVLPRIQVQQCLPDLLRLCQAEHALPAVRSGGPVKLSVDLTVVDEAGRTWVVLMKTWQNVVSGEHRPTFVLENTADFVRANRLAQGDTLAFCPHHGRMLLRTSLRADQLLPRSLKRGAGAAAAGGTAAAKRRATGKASPLAARTPEPPSRRHKGPAGTASPEQATVAAAAVFWQPSQAHVAEAAHALLQMHGAGSCLDSGASDCDHVCSPLASTGAPAAASTRAGPVLRSTTPPTPTLTAAFPKPASLGPHQPIYRPKPLHHAAAAALQQQQQQQRMRGYTPGAGAAQAAAALAAPQPHSVDLLPSPPPLSGSLFKPHAAAPGSSSLPADALAQASAWLATLLTQQEQERRFVEAYNRILLMQVLQQEHMQAQQAQHTAQQAQQQHFAGFDA